MENELKNLSEEIRKELENASNLSVIENIRVKYIGKKGILSTYFEKLSILPKEERPKIGLILNTARNELESKIEQKKVLLTKEIDIKKEDITLPGYNIQKGSFHPITRIIDEIKSIFNGLNFDYVEGPEIETDYYNFEALNTPEYHPARDQQSTFYLSKNILLRTHTSPVQIRTMEKQKPPIRMIAIGKCYRSDALDASHTPMFHQVEGLMIDENITFGNLKGILKVFFSQMFEAEVSIRLTPSYFPFTEPSAEVAFSCVVCKGKGCSVCKGTGWLEVFGAGMVDPNVLKYVNYDSEKWTGFAFGGGIERLAIIKHRINDIRLFYDNDLRFLNQF